MSTGEQHIQPKPVAQTLMLVQTPNAHVGELVRNNGKNNDASDNAAIDADNPPKNSIVESGSIVKFNFEWVIDGRRRGH